MQVIATGRLKQRSYEDRDGVKRTVVELDVDDIGPTLRFATAQVVKATRAGQKQPAQDGAVQRTSGPGRDDPWAAADTGASTGSGWGAQHDDQPPF